MTVSNQPPNQDPGAENERLRFALQAAGIGSWDLNFRTQVAWWDQRTKELYGVEGTDTRDFASAGQMMQYVHELDQDRVLQAMRWALNPASGGQYEIEFRIIRRDDEQTRWLLAKGQAYFDEQGRAVRFSGTAQDTTQPVLTRQKLEESQAGMQGAIELAQLGTWSIDVATQGLTYSDRLIEWFGYDPNAQDYTQVIPILEPGDQERVAAAVARALTPESDGVYEAIYTVIHPQTGQKRVLHALGKTVFDATGKAIRLNGTAQDITLQRELQAALQVQVQQRTQELAATNQELAANLEEYAALNQALQEANRRLNRSNENLQQFAYVASHDLQEPLRKIQSFGDLLHRQYADQLGEGLPYLERMQSAASRMSTLIRDLLSYSRISVQPDHRQLVSLSAVLQTVLSDLEVVIADTGAVVHVEPLPALLGDSLQLGQLFQNLLSNALKFSGKSQLNSLNGRSPNVPAIRVSSQPILAKDLPPSVRLTPLAPWYHRIDVADNGIGFEQMDGERIFQLFQRLHGKNEFAGTGIGLAICAKVVINHQGAIQATSQPGQGATFSVYLPG